MHDTPDLSRCYELGPRMTRAKVVVLTGAGISAESGIPTFRGVDGLWNGHRIEEVASPEGFAANPDLVWEFYNQRRRNLLSPEIQPNAAHLALAAWEKTFDEGEFVLVTQNVDDLHLRAGSKSILAMHGELLKARCLDTGDVFDWRDDLTSETPHPRDPSKRGRLRPHIVWFGEMPFHMDEIVHAVQNCTCFVAIGTSGKVYPAAGLVSLVPDHCWKVEINLDSTDASPAFDDQFTGPATEQVPLFLQEFERREGIRFSHR
jgi:NAD-dependent deacetylase